MNVRTKRHIASWVLLVVFLPMLILSSVHVHETPESIGSECSGCVQHHCHGHIGELTTSMHACVLCQFLTMSFVAAAVFTVVLFHKANEIHFAQRRSDILLEACGINKLRAPPFFE